VNAHHRKNNIQCLQHQGGWATNHEDKANLLQNYFTAVMGAPPTQARDFNWAALNVQQFYLAALEAPFTSEEILKTISLTPSEKAPGPDGFTANFFKSC